MVIKLDTNLLGVGLCWGAKLVARMLAADSSSLRLNAYGHPSCIIRRTDIRVCTFYVARTLPMPTQLAWHALPLRLWALRVRYVSCMSATHPPPCQPCTFQLPPSTLHSPPSTLRVGYISQMGATQVEPARPAYDGWRRVPSFDSC